MFLHKNRMFQITKHKKLSIGALKPVSFSVITTKTTLESISQAFTNPGTPKLNVVDNTNDQIKVVVDSKNKSLNSKTDWLLGNNTNIDNRSDIGREESHTQQAAQVHESSQKSSCGLKTLNVVLDDKVCHSKVDICEPPVTLSLLLF